MDFPSIVYFLKITFLEFGIVGLSFVRKNYQFICNENISLLKVVADFIEEKTATDDCGHGGEVDGQVVVNIALATF